MPPRRNCCLCSGASNRVVDGQYYCSKHVAVSEIDFSTVEIEKASPPAKKQKRETRLLVGAHFKRNTTHCPDCPMCDATLPTLQDAYLHALDYHRISSGDLLERHILGKAIHAHMHAPLYTLGPDAKCVKCNASFNNHTLCGVVEHHSLKHDTPIGWVELFVPDIASRLFTNNIK